MMADAGVDFADPILVGLLDHAHAFERLGAHHAPGLHDRELAVIENRIGLPFAILIGMYLKDR